MELYFKSGESKGGKILVRQIWVFSASSDWVLEVSALEGNNSSELKGATVVDVELWMAIIPQS